MIYLNKFKFATIEEEEKFEFSEMCYNTKYPFGILSKNEIKIINFDTITIFYGGNGSGKTTALNIIAEKLRLKRENLYNSSNFFEKYLNFCDYKANKIPLKSRIITSDDVFDFTMSLRHINEGINMRREELFDEYDELKHQDFTIKSLADYDKFRNEINKQKIFKRQTKTQFVLQSTQNNIKEQSNGESGFLYFTNKIEENALYLLDEPENSLSPERQHELLQFIQDSARFYNCQFIIATHSPFLLSLKDAKIYDFDTNPCRVRPWTELKNVRDYYNFFKLHEKEFENIETKGN